jgi:phage-related protein
VADIVFPPELPLPDLPLEEEYEDPGYRSAMSDGSTIGRRRFTRSRLTNVALNWRVTELTKEQYETIKTFINVTIGGSARNFQWTHPVTGVTYQKMRLISKDKFSYGPTGNETYSFGMVIGEA